MELKTNGVDNDLLNHIPNQKLEVNIKKLLDLDLELPDLETVRFAGGEPFIMPEVEEFLYKLVEQDKTNLKITTNKNLYNYLYTGLIASQIPNAKIIHCFRNPLDNILSIYRTNFKKGNEYSSSLVDCARVYLDQEKIMKKYKNRFPAKIYDLNYDSLVTNPNQEIKSLIKWLGWEWDDSYLSPHLNTRSVSTASNIQVRSPINSRSIGGWKNYKEMLKPAIAIITQIDRYRDLIL